MVIFKKNSPDLNLKIVYIFVLILILSALVQAGFYKEDAFVERVVSSIKKFYTDGKDLSGGGVLGGLISIPFLLMFKGLGTIIILTSAAIIDIILITNVSIAGVIVKIKNGILGLFDKLENKFKLSDKEIKDELIEDYNEPDIVMNGQKLPKVIDFNAIKEKDKKVKQNNDASNVAGIEKEQILEKVDVENEEVDFIVKDIKKIREFFRGSRGNS